MIQSVEFLYDSDNRVRTFRGLAGINSITTATQEILEIARGGSQVEARNTKSLGENT